VHQVNLLVLSCVHIGSSDAQRRTECSDVIAAILRHGMSMKQVSVQLPTSADIVTLLAFAAKRRAAGGAHPKRPQTQPQTKTATD